MVERELWGRDLISQIRDLHVIAFWHALPSKPICRADIWYCTRYNDCQDTYLCSPDLSALSLCRGSLNPPLPPGLIPRSRAWQLESLCPQTSQRCDWYVYLGTSLLLISCLDRCTASASKAMCFPGVGCIHPRACDCHALPTTDNSR